MTFEEKAEIVINQLRADRDRLLDAIEKIRAEIANLTCDCINGMVNQYAVLQIIDKYAEQEPISVSVSEKEPDEISEEVTLRFFRNSLKVRWQDMVIYNVEWLKKNWQMEMDIVCGVKPCDDAISREDAIHAFDYLMGLNRAQIQDILFKLPSVRPQEQTGHWIKSNDGYMRCDQCGSRGSAIKARFCHHCGAKMVEPQESEEISERNMKMWEAIFKAERTGKDADSN